MRRKRRLINAVPRLSKAIEHQIAHQQVGRKMSSMVTPDFSFPNSLSNGDDSSDRDQPDRRSPADETPALGALG